MLTPQRGSGEFTYRQRAFSVGAGVLLVAAADTSRIYLHISAASGQLLVTMNSDPGAQVGHLINAGILDFRINWNVHGGLVCQEWYAKAGGAFSGFVTEVFYRPTGG